MDESPAKMYALATVLTILAIVAVMLRLYARRIKKLRPSWDDYLVILALVTVILTICVVGLTDMFIQKIPIIGTGVCMFVGAAIGSLGRHTQITPDGMAIFDGRVEVLFKIIFISQLTQTVTFGLTKVAVVLFYQRIFIQRTFSVVSWAMIGLNVIWTLAFFAANLLQCRPISGKWASLGAAPNTCTKTTTVYLAQAWSDVFTDVAILSMPLPWIWRLQMTRMRKIFVVLMLQLGTLVVCAGVAKLVIFHRIAYEIAVGNEDRTYLLTPTVYWPMVESSLGIVGACLPLLRPIFTDTPAKNTFSSLRAMISRSSLRSNNATTPSQDYVNLEARNVRNPENHPSAGAQTL